MTDVRLQVPQQSQRRSPIKMRSVGLIFLISLCRPVLSGDPDLIHVVQTRWGFDGTVQEQMFIPLSVEVRNLSPRPWQGTLQLERGSGREQRIGAIHEIAVSLQGDESRWLQFVPYIMDAQDEWRLSWGPKDQNRLQLPPAQAGPRPTVLVYDEDGVTPAGGVLRRLPEHLFPNTLSATDGLRGLIFNAAPFWQGARAQAFLDWLSRGGRVYLLYDDRGRFPDFHSPLQVLNQDREQFRVGAGLVQRIPMTIDGLDLNDARKKLFQDESADDREPDLRPARQSFDPWSQFESFWDRDEEVFLRLAGLVEFQRAWWAIYLAVLAYLLTLFPICYRIGRRCSNVRTYYSVFFGAALFFSIVFGMLGQIGGAARNRIQTAAIARPIGDDVFDLTAWSQLAAVHGGSYSLSFPGSGICLSTCQEVEQVRGTLRDGLDNLAQLQMPPASTRRLLHRAKLSLQCPTPELNSIASEGTLLQGLRIRLPECLDAPLESIAIYRGSLYFLQHHSGLLELDLKRPRRPLAEYLRELSSWKQLNRRAARPAEIDAVDYLGLLRPLLGNSYGLIKKLSDNALQQPTDIVRLALLVPLPASWQAKTQDFPDQGGVVLLLYDLPTN